MVFLAEDGTFFIGDAANRRTLMDPDRAAVQLKRRSGDTSPLLLGGTHVRQPTRHPAAHLGGRPGRPTAGSPPASVAVTHPAGWGGYKLKLLEQSIRAAGLDAAIDDTVSCVDLI